MLLFEDPSEQCPGGLTQAFSDLAQLLRSKSRFTARLYIGVGWHTLSSDKLLQLKKGYPSIIWSHGLGALAFYSAKPLLSFLRTLYRLPQLLVCTKILLRCSCLVVAYRRTSLLDTRSLDEVLAKLFRVPVRVIPNPIDTTCWYPSPTKSGYLAENSDSRSRCISVGRAEWQKGHQSAIQIASLAQENTYIDIMAPSSTGYISTLNSKAAELGMASHTFFHIGLPADQRRYKLQQASCLICWSETEYQSLSILEALSCGCPVVARPRGWLRNRSVPGVLSAHSLQGAAQLVDSIISDSNYRFRLGMAGRLYVESNHALPVIMSKWLQLEKDILGYA